MTKKEIKEFNKIPLFDSKGKKIELLELNKDIFTGKINNALLYQAIINYRANQRAGTASTKTRRDVSGSGKKPWRQKGTGRARVGSKRTPVWRGGGVVFGPHPRDFSYTLPKKIRKSAFVASLNAKLKDGEVMAMETVAMEAPKTKNMISLLKALKINPSVLFLVKEADKNLLMAARNIKKLKLKKVNEATALDVLSCDNVILAKDALPLLEKRAKI